MPRSKALDSDLEIGSSSGSHSLGSKGGRHSNIQDSGLSVVYKPEHDEPTIDIVFIHGLQGHPFKTWAIKTRDTDVAGQHIPSAESSTTFDSEKAKFDKQKPSKMKSFFSRVRKSDEVRDETAHSTKYWTFWPRDLLPQRCPEAQILVFGYDTIVAKHHFAGAANRNSIFAHSRALANDLARFRQRRRPIIFIAHSLGGIVVKELLAICSTSINKDFEDILKSTAGIIFMGTPHRGSAAAEVGDIARRAAKMLGMDTNSSILGSLSLKSADLERCQDVFSSLWQKYNFQVKTFQEGLPLKSPVILAQSAMVKIVPDTSSCLGDSRERAETLDGDHRSMCRFSNASEPNYVKVSSEIRYITDISYKALCTPDPEEEAGPGADPAAINASFALNERVQDALKTFEFPNMDFRLQTIDRAVENTCEWLPTIAVFNEWINGKSAEEGAGLLQIIGKPGSGKSTLMKHLFERSRLVNRDEGTVVIGFFFNSRGQELEHCTRGFLRAFLYQLFNLYPACIDRYDRTGVHASIFLEFLRVPSFEYTQRLKLILEQIFTTPKSAPPKTLVFVDALDECDGYEALETGYFLDNLVRLAHKTNVQLWICVSRREYPSLTIRDSRIINMEAYNRSDIQEYIRQKLERADVDSKDAMVLQTNLLDRSNGIFLWVALAVQRILGDLEKGKNTKNTLERTLSLPKALSELYATLLSDIQPPDRQVALRLFQWATLAQGRLRLREWHHILAFIRDPVPTSLREWKESIHYTGTDLQLERQIRALSCGLLEVKGGTDSAVAGGGDDGDDDCDSNRAGAGSLDSKAGDSRIIQPIHETVIEFFIKGHAQGCLEIEPLYDFRGSGHLLIATTCLDYIAIEELDCLVKIRLDYLEIEEHYRERKMRLASSQASPAGDESERIPPIETQRVLSRRHSATSFMSSASAHSKGSTLSFDHEPSSLSRGTVFLSDESLAVNSLKSQTLEDYPALASYALNKTLVHMKSAWRCDVDPSQVLIKLVQENRWNRWYALQEGITKEKSVDRFFEKQNMANWASALRLLGPSIISIDASGGMPKDVDDGVKETKMVG